MRKPHSILFIALIIISALTTIPLLTVNAQNTEPNVTVNKTATAYNITCGQEINVTLTVTGRGLGGLFDIMLVIDRSESMTGEPLAAAKAAAKSFIDNRTFTGDPATSDWIGVVSYSTNATLNQGLTADHNLAKSAIDGLTATGYTNIMAGVHIAQQELATHGRNYAMDVMIVLSDGVANRWTDFTTGTIYSTTPWPKNHTTSTLKAIEEATLAKGNGTMVFTIGLNLANLGISEWVARDTLKQMASSLDYFFDAANPGYLEEIYQIISTYMAPAGTNLTLTDIVEDEFIIVGGSINPPPTSIVGNTITWNFSVLGSETKTFQYKIRPKQGLEGWYPTNVNATLDYIDHEGNPQTLIFPIPTVELYRVCTPAIQINKTADPTVIHSGDKVVYTYEVYNPGPYPLHDVYVTDDKLGYIAGPFDLAVGETRTFTKEATPAEDVTNWGNATGKDPWNYTVTDTDDATVNVITGCQVVFYTIPSDVGNITVVGNQTYLNGQSGTWDYGTSFTAIANAPVGWVFDHWEVTGNITVLETVDNSITVTINCGGALNAYFRRIQCPVVFFTDPTNVGNITFEGDTYINGASDTFPYGTSGEARANTPDGWIFDHWTTVGNVQVSSTTTNPTTFTITCGGNLTAVFRPQEEPPTLDPRTIGFWKHQVYVYLFNRGTAQITEEELLGYLEQVSSLSNYTKFEQIYVGDNDLTLWNAYRILRFSWSMKGRAEQQLLATWLNVVSNKLSWNTPLDSGIYGDLETVGEAITYCENVLINSIVTKYEEAKTICDNINNGIGIG